GPAEGTIDLGKDRSGGYGTASIAMTSIGRTSMPRPMGVAVALLASGCAFLPELATPKGNGAGQALAQGVPPLAGHVDFGTPTQQTQATIGQIATAATVSLIDTSSNTTVATSVTNASGSFTISNFGNWTPTPNAVYILEAIKGLDSNVPGNNAARVRTFIEDKSDTWVFITTGTLTVDPSTTALGVMESDYQAASTGGLQASAANYIGLITATASGSPDTLAMGQQVVGPAYTTVYGYVTQAITNSWDPIASIQYNAAVNTFFLSSSFAASTPMLTGVSPNVASAGTTVTLYGQFFANSGSGDTVSFNGATDGAISSGNPTTITVNVPADATTGPLTVQTANGTSNSVTFTVVPGFAGTFGGTQ
ncbi:MAG: IPT/TIG domain-containing protein, partial [Cyanobacteria bacterium REEB65]|nr:IPT/TIG domain-containing protein [Cyanobacteria bacterium REEB65]